MQGQWVKWVLGIFAALIVASATFGGSTLVSHGEDIATSNARVDALQEGQSRIEKKQDELNSKLDSIYNHLIARP